MKKLLLFFILIQCSSLLGQTVLTIFPLELKKSKDYKQIVNAENINTHDVFAFASDKETITILKYNSALFLTNQYSLARPDISYKQIAGYSFNSDGNPTLYWSSLDLKKIMAVQYDLNAKTTALFNYDLQFFNQEIIAQFQENNTFYMLSQKQFEEKLVLYIFKDGKIDEKTLDFSSFKFQNTKQQPITFSQILEVCPIEKIETNQFNPLFKGTQKTKLYVLKNKLLLTFDHNDNETQAFEIDLTAFGILEKNIPKTATNHVALSNSYYHESKIYQFKANTEELLFEIKDYKTLDIIKSILVSKTETIPFKTSPLWLQLEGEKPRELKNTAKFLNQIVYLGTGLTVYKTPKSILITLGGSGNIQFTDTSQDFSNVSFRNVPTTVYFESVFDKKLDHTKQVQEPLAIDFISGFMQQHPEVTLTSIIRYKNYYIMGYYDTYAKQYTMRKFIDGFE
jgi:hypothetical protein